MLALVRILEVLHINQHRLVLGNRCNCLSPPAADVTWQTRYLMGFFLDHLLLDQLLAGEPYLKPPPTGRAVSEESGYP